MCQLQQLNILVRIPSSDKSFLRDTDLVSGFLTFDDGQESMFRITFSWW